MAEEQWRCVCGKPCKLGEVCSPRCAYIAAKMNTPLGQAMDNQERAVRFFGKQYDKNHGEAKQ